MVRIIIGVVFICLFAIGTFNNLRSVQEPLGNIILLVFILLIPRFLLILFGRRAIRRRRMILQRSVAMFEKSEHIDPYEVSRELKLDEIFVRKTLWSAKQDLIRL